MAHDTPTPTRFEPPVSDDTAPFWEATRDKQLVLQWCTSCQKAIFYPRAACPGCLGDTIEWRPATGFGRVHAVSVQHKPANPFMADKVPYAVALVDLDEGVRLMTNIVGCEPDDVAVDMAVRVTWEPLTDGRHLPLFEPSALAD
ncbi:MAG TPA: OB-fold domain-containing protein [Acidimicrobiales bacterium]|nr:OB-fold domain-containing protein [Acidimicrobiales bacterium]